MTFQNGPPTVTPLVGAVLGAEPDQQADLLRLLNQGGGASGVQRTNDLNIPGYNIGEIDVSSELTQELVRIPATYRLQILSWPHAVSRLEVRIGDREAPPIDVTRSGRTFVSAFPFDRIFVTTEDAPKSSGGDIVIRYITGTLQISDKLATRREPDWVHASRGWPASGGTVITAPQTLGDNSGSCLTFSVDRAAVGSTVLLSNVPAQALFRVWGSIQSLLPSVVGTVGDADVVFDDPPDLVLGSFVSPTVGSQIYYFDNIQLCKDVQRDIVFRVNALGPVGNSWHADVKAAVWDQGA